ncbi:hypothetical protein GLOTRDRAFT_114507 [Gloeophyllum trabeum ATCC 11539]|uniref:BTB domain-containing protein n=1 Tax=Gloeophyllum trabeum (strain ATCC 11539 / FP-39264 / Madison 617) TaxID=670483 RepID=S7QF46_GLOTA|nr:uncharacterized protein GLOTRDRAFT_114507 [Gloeophyllum trabeum ATCC 11539]EPQ57943.1 hypothetical protein GLOTRDRAFT_114507 [Gloeophyllum trabeum ATCC 11539]
MDQLHRLAPCYWGNMETTDCTLIIPVFDPPKADASALRSSISNGFAYSNPKGHDPLGRRATEPNLNITPRIVMKLHMDYLSAHSSFLRALFSGSNPLDLINTTLISSPASPPPPTRSSSPSPPSSPSPVTPMSPSEEPFLRRHAPPSSYHYPHLLPCSPRHPIVYLPVPDPSSIRLLIHYMYFGMTDYIEACLIRGDVKWDGLARNVEYLGIRGIRGWLAGWLERLDSDDDDFDVDFDQMDLDGDTDVEDDMTDVQGSPRGRDPSPRSLSKPASTDPIKLPT